MMGAFLLGQIPLILEELARGGGGGSGGGGGGGGGGGSSGSSGSGGGGIFYIVGLAGYIPMHFLGALLRKNFFKDHWVGARIVGWVVAGLVAAGSIISIFIFRSFLIAFYVNIPIAVGALLGIAAGLQGWATKIGQNAKVKNAIAVAAGKDYVWNEANLNKYVQGIFYKFQQDWTNFDITSMGTYMSPNYHKHTALMMAALKGAHRVNKVVSPRIFRSEIVSANDSENNDEDSFEVMFMANADDQLIDDRTNTLLFQDKNTFTEYWQFIRSGNNWLFDGIQQATVSNLTTSNAIAQFAGQNGLYYSADWGWLLLPADGYLFSHGKFGTSDINNHVIGYVNNVLTQLYTYTPNPNGSVGDEYLVVQTNVPKTYGRILVRRRSKFINWPVKGLTQVKMEWGEFNDMYDVYASDLERVTSFELLNPSFMANLRDLPFEVNIEVTDNVVYLFTKGRTDINTYKTLYEIVLKAHKEMNL
jgi:hypothetical protein